MSKAIYAFSGDPITFGHLNIIQRAAKIFEQVIVAIGVNPSKNYMFNLEERTAMAKTALASLTNVQVVSFQGLLVDFAYEMGAQVIVKGVRSTADFDYEQSLHQMGDSQKLNIDTVLFFADPKLAHISSSAVKQIQQEQGLIHDYVPLNVKQALEKQMSKQYIVGVTGEIGAGKSYVCEQLITLAKQANLPIHHLDMDEITHEILASLSEPVYQQVREAIVKVFGEQIKTDDGFINRKALGEIVFNDPAKLEQLNQIMYQPLLVRLRRALYQKEGLILLNAALLIESGITELCNNNLILVKTSKALQQQRLQERGLSAEQINRRLESAYSYEQKKEKLLRQIQLDHHGQLWEVNNMAELAASEIEKVFGQLVNYFDLSA